MAVGRGGIWAEEEGHSRAVMGGGVLVRAVVGEGGGYQWGMVSAAEAAGKADILIKQPRAKSH